MMTIDWKDIRRQISEIATLVEEYDDADEDGKYHYEEYSFSDWILVNNKAVYVQGNYTNDFDKLSLYDFAPEDEDLAEYFEAYELEELERKIA